MNGIIYGIKDLLSEKIIYIGSTTNLRKRKVKHRYDCFTKQKELLVYDYIRERTNRDQFDESFSFEELYSGEFETKEDLRMKENEFIKDKEPQCNQIKAFQSEDERQEYMRNYQKTEKIREYQREYYKTEKWREYQREYMREYMREWRRRKKLAQE
jgi:hypothetical protein